MASKSSRTDQVGATPKKLALIGVLGVVLIVVLYVQFRPSGDELPVIASESPVRPRPAAGRAKTSQTIDPAATAEPSSDVSTMDFDKWRPQAMATVVQHDPFALPASFPQPLPTNAEAAFTNLGDDSNDQVADAAASLDQQIQQSRAELESLRNLGVQVLMRQGDGYVAMVGDRTIHVGDEINGFTVVAIDANGVRVARDLKP